MGRIQTWFMSKKTSMFEYLELVNIWKQTKCTSSKYVKLKLVTNCKKKKKIVTNSKEPNFSTGPIWATTQKNNHTKKMLIHYDKSQTYVNILFHQVNWKKRMHSLQLCRQLCGLE